MQHVFTPHRRCWESSWLRFFLDKTQVFWVAGCTWTFAIDNPHSKCTVLDSFPKAPTALAPALSSHSNSSSMYTHFIQTFMISVLLWDVATKRGVCPLTSSNSMSAPAAKRASTHLGFPPVEQQKEHISTFIKSYTLLAIFLWNNLCKATWVK